jgi:hypothetical protein
MRRPRLPSSLTLVLLIAVARAAAAQQPAPGDSAARPALPDADSIVRRAIARRHDVLSSVGHVRYDAYVKFVSRDLSPRRDPARTVLFLAETHSSAYWEPHRRYQETIEARHQTRGLGAPRSLVAVSDIADVNQTQIVLGGYTSVGRSGGGGFDRAAFGRERGSRQYALLSPLGRDAPDHYDFRLLDTLDVDGRRAFRLAVIPRSSATPLFVGTIVVADSTFDLLAMDLGVNDAVRFSSVKNIRYQEQLGDAGGGRWMPVQIRLTGEVRPRITAQRLPREVAGIPVPGLPEEMAFEQIASLGGFRFDDGERPQGLGEYRVIVNADADHPDSAVWSAPGAVPLSDAERAAWARSDSTARHPPTLIRIGQGIGAVGELASNPGYFHFNRVDGYYLGLAPDWRAAPGLLFSTKLGYALGSETWQYRLSGQARLSEDRRLWVGVSYHDETVSRSTLVSSRYNPTFRALFARVDPLDYYHERGLTLSLRTKLLNLTQLELGYDDERQASLDTVPGYSFRSTRFPARGNPPIVAGRLRSLSATLSYDSRQMVRSGGGEYRLAPMSWTRIAVGVEAAAPSLIPDDFSYRRYSLQVDHAQPTLGMGMTTVSASGGIATGQVPPQRYFTVDFGMEVLAVEGNGFSTLSRTNYYGNRAAMVTVRHDFDRLLFTRSGVPLIRDLPFTLSLHAGMFWTDLANHTPNPGDSMLATAPTPYSEVGFSLGNLTPFLTPFNLSARFSWQLSSYATRRFRFGFGISGP